ncbi:MAG: PIN domain-containing protein [Candidatus Diapherotrites archaeon]
MQLVVDTNIIVSALLRKGDTRRLVFSKRFELFSPDRVKFEIAKNKHEFMQKGSMNEEEFLTAVELLLGNVSIVPAEEYAPLKNKADSLCPKGHEDDWPFIALSLKLNCGLWSQDSALKKQSIVNVYSTAGLIALI